NLAASRRAGQPRCVAVVLFERAWARCLEGRSGFHPSHAIPRGLFRARVLAFRARVLARASPEVCTMDKDELLERYEAVREESYFLAAKPLFERDIRERDVRGQPDPILLRQYGYLLECHGRITIRRAVEQYERAIALDPDADKVQYQWISAKASLSEQEHTIA